jgi:hypothetical protein
MVGDKHRAVGRVQRAQMTLQDVAKRNLGMTLDLPSFWHKF